MKTLNEREISSVSAGYFSVIPFLCGATLGVVGYSVSNKYDFHVTGFALAGISGGLTAILESSLLLQILTVATFSEIISRIQSSTDTKPAGEWYSPG